MERYLHHRKYVLSNWFINTNLLQLNSHFVIAFAFILLLRDRLLPSKCTGRVAFIILIVLFVLKSHHFLLHGLIFLHLLINYGRIIVADTITIVEINSFYLLIYFDIFLSVPDCENRPDYLYYISNHHNSDNDDVVCLQNLLIFLIFACFCILSDLIGNFSRCFRRFLQLRCWLLLNNG